MPFALYRKWRPRRFEEVVGQEHVTHTLRNALRLGRIAHAYLFAGPRGTGKTTTARLLAKAVNCLAESVDERPCDRCRICQAVNEGRLIDLIEIDAASNRGIDEIRDLRERVRFSPSEARYKVYVIDEAHMLTSEAFNALLKTLEEPPPHVIFVLATTEPHRIPATILSRCQRFDFRRLSTAEIIRRLEEIVAAEGIAAEPEALTWIARQATGSLRDAITLLDQLAADEEPITVERVQRTLGAGRWDLISQVVEALGESETARGLTLIAQAVEEGAYPQQLARQLVEYLRAVMWIQWGDPELLDLPAEQIAMAQRHARALPPEALPRLIRLFTAAASDMRTAWQPQLALELAFVEAILACQHAQTARTAPAPTPAPPPSAAPPSPMAGALPPSSPVAVPGAGTGSGSLTLEALRERWASILKAVRAQSLPTEALLKSCSLHSVEGNTVVLAWPSELLRDKFQDPRTKAQALVEDILSHTFGFPVIIKNVVARKTRRGRPATEDPLIRRAVEDLGAQVEEE
ncbi:DNA polymerase III subunit gamma/tau [Thermoflexus sp.]|uniref:DNA polymerase III subunit gamma/tau n=1 Tax=Thermoflexus sp. TaxID=1969742 RepID=UPI0025E1BD18|nr:DNA polymerase III subunit gamma/tau [Thermoflexus sp.]MDW8064544.1 DNA polymerase III subunit gamma/tau [Anaerolineae bacterium]MCS6962581.1 DNA polymerase III subunit gamma/tau [Thermoflexus sp.]MCS7350733.1 DNA polymerase III subunit gamma/tau [Thermoflexus sp.]MCX7691404.1 DNA polymerase III subunit gamma/tau [Thermoflexus sp.]MDW8180184.1 DNA polymerase III subunit gamma/tau [Anaerolineae bacterium]